MRVPWKVLGLAGVAGVAATGVVVARKRRAQTEYDPDELRDRLHSRLADAAVADGDEVSADAEPPAEAGPADGDGAEAEPGH
jgi:hypothetical protein